MLKRSFDILAASTTLLLALPLMAAIAVAVLVTMGRPVLYRQKRLGLDAQAFEIIKFRTMRTAKSEEAELFSDEQRVTRLGRMLRASSLDELPELWLVVVGQMSLVGPRPLLPIYLELYRGEHWRRHEVRPGLTGLAQVNGRQDLTLKQRLDLDVDYVCRRRLRLDLTILLRTVVLVILGNGVRTGQSLADIDDIGLAEALSRNAEATQE